MSDEFYDIDFEKVEILRGETPVDIQQKCYDLCKDYLGGIWAQIGVKDINIKRISGGFSNQLYHCALHQKFDPNSDEPRDVAIRLYGEQQFNIEENVKDKHKDMIISLLTSEYNLGPKIYGIFPEGEIQQYCKHRQFRVDEQKDPLLVVEMARKLSRFHSLKVPIKKKESWLMKVLEHRFEESYKKFAINQMINQYECDVFKKNDIHYEFNWLKKCVLVTKSPICFSHNDFRGNNIMVNELDLNDNQVRDYITFCDFETSNYDYRGIDFGTIFGEWDRDLNGYKDVQQFPEDSTLRPFIEEYIAESVKIYGNSYSDYKINSFEQILKEIKVFTLVSNMFMLISCLFLDPPKEVPTFTKKFLMIGANVHFDNYLHLKNQFLKEKSIPHDID